MKILLLTCLAIGWASTEKLDRSYLPPPGSKFSGGSPGDIQVPLEFPKLNYSTGRTQIGDGVSDTTLGINRRPLPTEAIQSSTQKPDGFTYFQNSYAVPKTTTSYAFTQTTTFAPIDDYIGIDQNLGSLNASTTVQQSRLPEYPQISVEDYQRRQPIRGQSSSQRPSYNLYEQGQNLQPTSTPSSTSQRPQFVNNQSRLAYLPPVPSFSYKGQMPFSQIPYNQGSVGYPSGQPQGHKYQDGEQFASTTGPGFIEGANQQNQFFGKPIIAAPQYQGDRYDPSIELAVNQQKFGLRAPTQKNQQRFPQTQNVPSSTATPQQFTNPESVEQNFYTDNQKLPSSTSSTQYQFGQRFTTPASSQQRFGSRVPNQQTQSIYPGNQNFPSTTPKPKYQDEQQFATPGLFQKNQYPGIQNVPSTAGPPYQESQGYTTPGTTQEGFVPNQQISQVTNQETQNQYAGNKNIFSSTDVSQQHNGPLFTTPGTVQLQQENQYPVNQNFPSSTLSPQRQNENRYTGPGFSGQQNQNQYLGNQLSPSSTAAPPISNMPSQPGFGYPGSAQQNNYQNQENFPSSTVIPQYQDGQFIKPGLAQNQYSGNQNTPSTVASQVQNGQRFTTPADPLRFGSIFSNQQNYPGTQTTVQSNQQYPSTSAPQYQSTFASTPGYNQGFAPNQQNFDQYADRPGYNQQFTSTSAPQGLQPGSQSQYGNDGVQTLPDKSVTLPAIQGKPDTQSIPSYGNQQPSSQTSSQVYGTTPSAPGYSQDMLGVKDGSLPTRDFSLSSDLKAYEKNRPERPQATADRTAEIIRYDNMLTPEGYSYSYDTSNGIHADETGIVGDGTKAQGSYSYTGDDGKVYSVFYSADENGFQPRGDHLPTPPPIPEAIQRVIEQANKDKESGISDDGSYDEDKYGHTKYDGSLTSLRPQNKTISLVNGADIPNRYESRIGGQTKNQFKTKEGSKPSYKEDNSELEGITGEEQIDDENFDDSNDGKENNRRVSNKYSTSDQKLATEGVKLNKKMNNNAKTNSLKSRKPIDEKRLVSRPVSTKIDQDSIFDNVPVTERPDNDDDLQESQVFDDESELTAYKDDPNSRTDFHGINKYLPNSKGSNKLIQSDNSRLIARPDGNKQRVTTTNKLERPGNRKNQGTEQTIPGNERESSQDRIRTPVGNKPVGQQEFKDRKGESDIYGDNRIKANEKNEFDDKLESDKVDLPAGMYQFEKKIVGKLKRPNEDHSTSVSKNKNIQTILDEDIGYEYTPPQRKFDPEGAIKLPSRTAITEMSQFPPQKGGQTTIRPFITPNVYGNNKSSNEDDEDQFDERKPYRPVGPTSPQKPARKPSGQYGTRPSSQLFGRPQTTTMFNDDDQDTTGQERYNEPVNYQVPRGPGSKIIYGVNAPAKGASTSESNAFVSTTPLPNLESKPFNKYNRPGQYTTTNTPNDDISNFEETEVTNAQKPSAYRPVNTNSRGQVPSTTYRPSYTFGDRTFAPSGPIAVDGFGRPISSTNAPAYGKPYGPTDTVTQDTRVPVNFDEVSGNRPGQMGDKFRPSVDRFGVTSGPTQGATGVYEGSTSRPIGEDFSGPKQTQRFDPDTGYHY